MKEPKPIPLFFWQSGAGGEPVRELFHSFESADKKRIGFDIRTVQFGWPVGMPLVRSLGKGLHELRTSLPSRRELRVFFSIEAGRMVLLHAFIKKSRSTPSQDLALARKRLEEL